MSADSGDRKIELEELKAVRVISVDGVVVEGLHAASGFTIAAQMPCFEKEIPGIKASYHGTINLYLERQLRIDNPDRAKSFVCVLGPAKCSAFSKSQ